jgi:hypothetical protein
MEEFLEFILIIPLRAMAIVSWASMLIYAALRGHWMIHGDSDVQTAIFTAIAWVTAFGGLLILFSVVLDYLPQVIFAALVIGGLCFTPALPWVMNGLRSVPQHVASMPDNRPSAVTTVQPNPQNPVVIQLVMPKPAEASWASVIAAFMGGIVVMAIAAVIIVRMMRRGYGGIEPISLALESKRLPTLTHKATKSIH